MKKIFLLAINLFLFVFCLHAQNIKRPETYNYQRGLEAMQEEKNDEAIEFFNKDIKENPKNGYSFSWIAHLRLSNQDYGRALTAADMAIKYLPKKDEEYVIFAYSTRASTYLCLEDTLKALNDYSTAIKIKPDEARLYDSRGQIYYEQKRFDLSDADYKKMEELQPGSVMGYMGQGRNANAQKKWDEAIKLFDYVTKLSSDYSSGYSFRAEAYIGIGKWNEATDDIVTAMGLDWDRKALYLIRELNEAAVTMLIAKMRVQAAKSPNDAKWPYLIGTVYEENKQYTKAVEYYKEANTKDAKPAVYYRISLCQAEIGDFEEALSSVNQALNMDSTDLDYMIQKAVTYYEMGNPKAAISEWDKVLAIQPEYADGYYQRGWYKYLIRDFDNAAEDFSMCIALDQTEAYAYVCRGDIYLMQGKKDLAESDFKKVIEIEDTPEKYQCIHYAYQGLGLNDKAIETMDSIIARDEDRPGSYYDYACLYGRMGNTKKSLEYLEKSLDLGYKRFSHIAIDHDMDLIRDTDEFKALIKKYSHEKEKEDAPVAIGVFNVSGSDIDNSNVVEVPFTKENGVYKVKCEVNGLPLHFIFDTGASDVTISMVEATFMMKNGYLSDKDVVGSQKYMDANGNVSVGTIINLKEVYFGGQNLTNVRASVVRNQKAPLLLGQSVLSRLGKIEIDNQKQALLIKSIK